MTEPRDSNAYEIVKSREKHGCVFQLVLFSCWMGGGWREGFVQMVIKYLNIDASELKTVWALRKIKLSLGRVYISFTHFRSHLICG